MGLERFYVEVFGEFAVAIGTIILAFFTFVLANNETIERRNERRRLRLKERLENFYSPLMGYIHKFHDLGLHAKDTDISILMSSLKTKYVFYASSTLQEELKEYYKLIEVWNESVVTSSYYQKWEKMIKGIINIISEDYEIFFKEYKDLTEK